MDSPQTATPPGSSSGARAFASTAGLTENQHTLRMERALASALMVSYMDWIVDDIKASPAILPDPSHLISLRLDHPPTHPPRI